jgi:hypothetical protein
MDIRYTTVILNGLFMMANNAFASPSYIMEENNYNKVSIENSVLVPTAQFSKVSGVEVYWANGVYYAKRQGLIIKILNRNVESVLRDLSRSELEKVITSKKPIRLYRNLVGEYCIEYLLVL